MKGFNVRKAAQVAAYLAKAEGGSINVLKLVKLIYLADRRFMDKYDAPILNDRLVSMDHGPVNSVTLNLINGLEDAPDWNAFVSDRANHQVGVANPNMTDRDLDQLSRAELRVLGEVWEQFKGQSGYQVRDYTHRFCPEWENPKGSSEPIPYARVFKHLNKKDPEYLAEAVEAERRIDGMLAAE